jgi:hypothetical protein
VTVHDVAELVAAVGALVAALASLAAVYHVKRDIRARELRRKFRAFGATKLD